MKRTAGSRGPISVLWSALLVVPAACGGLGSTPPAPQVRPGLEVFLAEPPAWIVGKRIGLITNHTGIDLAGRRNIDRIMAHPELKLTTLFAFEHGLRGVAPPGAKIDSGTDEATGLPVHSLYGEVRKPTPEMLRDVDVLMYDVQDIGARPYTRVSTMVLSMQAAAEKGIPFVVLDRPNPLGGVEVEGNLLEPAFASFVGMYPIPLRHGMTVGELARMYNREHGIGAELTVIPVAGWKRDMWLPETGMPWVGTSPSIQRMDAGLLYPGTVLLEGTNLSEGRGTRFPFEQTGAPWLRAAEVADSMNALGLPGVRFEAIEMEIAPDAGKYGGQTVPAVRILVIDRDRVRPVLTAVRLIDVIRRLHPDDFAWRGANQREPTMLTIDRLAGTDRLRKSIEAGTLEEYLESWAADEARHRAIRAAYLLYD